MSMTNASDDQSAASAQMPSQPEADQSPITNSGDVGRETANPTPKEVAEIVYRLFCEDLRRERERLRG